MKVRDIMKPAPVVIGETDTLGNAQDAMTMYKIRHLPVIDEGKLVGMLSERDVLVARAHCEPDDEWWKIPVHVAMQAPARTAHPEDSLLEIAARMAADKLDALPVVERGHLLGILTVIDVLDAEVRTQMAAAP